MRILVTGATGFLGRHLVPALLCRSHQVVATARDSNKAAKMPWISDADFIPYDLHDTTQNPARQLGIPDCIIHLAWPGLPSYHSPFHYETNLPAAYHFLKTMVAAGTRQVLIAGTCFEYGMRNGQLGEDFSTNPITAYGLAKDTLRRFLQVLQIQRPFVLQWIRLFYIYGEGQHPNSLFAQLRCAIDRGDPVFNMSGGEQLRDYLPVEEAARLLAALAEKPECTGVINCCSGKPISIRRLVEDWIRKNHWPIALNLEYYPYPEYEPFAFWGDTEKLSHCLQINSHES